MIQALVILKFRRESYLTCPRNLILASLAAIDWEQIEPLLKRVSLRRRQVLEEPRTNIQYVYFIESGLAAVQMRSQSDGVHDLGLLGRCSMTGLPLVLGTMRSLLRVVVQTSGEAWQLRAADAVTLFNTDTALRRSALGYVQARMINAAHAAVCNARHPAEHRIRRWLLLAHQLLEEDEICVSHATIASHLGIRRPTVSEHVKKLEKAGLVSQRFRCIKVQNRTALEQGSCECHRLIWSEYRRVQQPNILSCS